MSEEQSSGSALPEPSPRDSVGPSDPAGLPGPAGPSATTSGAAALPPSGTAASSSTSSAGDDAPLPPFDVAGLLAGQVAEVDEGWVLSAAEIAALPLLSEEPPDLDDVPWWLTDEFFGSDEAEEAAWLRGLPADVAAGWRDGPRSDDMPGAGFTHHDQGIGPRPEAGFAAGGVLDSALPGPVLAAAAHAASSRGDGLGESELIGVLCAWQRLASWTQAGLAGCLNVLVARRKDQSVELRAPALAEHVDGEVAAALALTGQSAVRLLAVAGELGRLPVVLAALAAGRIDWAKAVLVTDGLAGLADEDASDIADAVLSGADGRTTGQLRAALARAVLAYDPQAARRRRERARKDASVQSWTEGSGNSCLAGRELEPADVIEASARLTALARWLREQGAAGSTDELRAAAFVASLTGRPLDSLLPPDTTPGGTGDVASDGASSGDASGGDVSGGDVSGGDASGDDASGYGAPGRDCPAAGTGDADQGTGDGAGQPAGSSQPDRRGGAAGCGAASRGPAGSGADGDAAVAGEPLGGTINLTMPLSAWLGLGDGPGEVAGYGPADAGTCRDLAARTGPGTRWCLTLTGADGRAVAHACAAGPPGPPGAGAVRWAAAVRARLQFLEAGTCGHARRSSRYRPLPNLVHLLRVRQRTCSFPGCRRPARRCDLDQCDTKSHVVSELADRRFELSKV